MMLISDASIDTIFLLSDISFAQFGWGKYCGAGNTAIGLSRSVGDNQAFVPLAILDVLINHNHSSQRILTALPNLLLLHKRRQHSPY